MGQKRRPRWIWMGAIRKLKKTCHDTARSIVHAAIVHCPNFLLFIERNRARISITGKGGRCESAEFGLS